MDSGNSHMIQKEIAARVSTNGERKAIEVEDFSLERSFRERQPRLSPLAARANGPAVSSIGQVELFSFADKLEATAIAFIYTARYFCLADRAYPDFIHVTLAKEPKALLLIAYCPNDNVLTETCHVFER